jgi:hypothetical protein
MHSRRAGLRQMGAQFQALQSRRVLIFRLPICMAKENTRNRSNGGGLGFEAQLRAAADKMWGHMDASEYVWD